jgi:hypothetical protein
LVRKSQEKETQLIRRPGPVDSMYVGYEAGPCGYGIYRQRARENLQEDRCQSR